MSALTSKTRNALSFGWLCGVHLMDSLELRLERIKRAGNLSMDFLQRLYNWKTVGDNYAKNRLDFHVHADLNGLAICGRFRCCGDADELIVRDKNEIIVFVDIAKVGEMPRPIASAVRLQTLDCCYMRGVQTSQGNIFPSFETVWRVLDRELGSSLGGARVKVCEFGDEVIQCRAETMCNIAKQSVIDVAQGARLARAYRLLRIRCYDYGLSVGFANGVVEGFQTRQVFACPPETEICMLQG
jgi:hypothetical protein